MSQIHLLTKVMFQKLHNFLTPQRQSYALITGVALWIAWLVSIILGPGNFDLNHKIIGTDYVQFYSAGLTLLKGEESRLFDFTYQRKLELAVAGGDFEGYHAFINPPFHAWLFIPFAALPYTLSFVVWSFVGLVLFYISLRWLSARHPNHVFLWSLTWFPVFASISFGQNSILSLALFSLIYLLLKKDKYFIAGLAASVLLYKPQLVMALGLFWLLEWKKAKWALVGLVFGTGVFLGLSFFFLPQSSLDYLTLSRTLLPNLASWEGFPIYNAHMWRAFWILLLPGLPAVSEGLALITMLAGVAAFVIFWRAYRERQSLLYAGVVCLTIWTTPHAMIYDWVLLLIPAVILWDTHRESRHTWRVLFALVWLVTLLSAPLTLAQLAILPAAVQISLPVFAWACFIANKTISQRG